MKKNFFVCFTGVDGSGKTTLSNLLIDSLAQKGIYAEYAYTRYIPSLIKPAMILGRILFLRNKNIYINYRDYSSCKQVTSSRYPLLAKMYKKLLLLDYLIQIFIKINVPLYLGRNIICDRYIYDTIITDLSIDFNYSREDIQSAIKYLHNFCPIPNIIFLVDIPGNIALSRKKDIPSLDYISDRRNLYKMLALLPETFILDGSKNLDELRLTSLNKVLEML